MGSKSHKPLRFILALSAANLVVTLVGSCSPFGEGSLRDRNFYPVAPVVSSLSQSGSLGVATTSIYGSGFESSTTMKIGGVSCASFSVVSATELSCTTSASLGVGLWDVAVTNSFGQTGTLARGFANLVAAPALWLRADALTALSDGEAVAQWTDISGNSRHAAQSSAPLRPIFKTAALNGKPVVHFAGVYPDGSNANPFLSIPAPGSNVFKFGSSTGFSVAIVTRTNTSGYYHQVIANESANNRTGFGIAFVGDPSAGTQIGMPFFTARNSCCPAAYGTKVANDNVWRLFTGVRTGDATDFYVNATRQGGVASGAAVSFAAARDLFIGRDPDNFFPWGGDIAEIILYPIALSSSQREIVEGHLLQKYGL